MCLTAVDIKSGRSGNVFAHCCHSIVLSYSSNLIVRRHYQFPLLAEILLFFQPFVVII